jgi:hypothetical protein
MSVDTKKSAVERYTRGGRAPQDEPEVEEAREAWDESSAARSKSRDCGGKGNPCERCNNEDPPKKTGMVRVIADKDGVRH